MSQRLSGLPAGEEDLEYGVDHKEGLKRSGGLDAPAMCSASGGAQDREASRKQQADWMTPLEHLGLDSGQRPRAHMSPHSPAQLGPAEEAADTRPLEEARPLSEEFMEPSAVNSLLEEDEDDEEPPRILLYHEPRSFEVGMLVWHKYQNTPSGRPWSRASGGEIRRRACSSLKGT